MTVKGVYNIDEKRIKICIIFLMIIISFIIIPSQSIASEPPPARLCWKEGEEVQVADVTSGGNNSVIFIGCVYIEYENISVSINLTATSEHNWPIQINPSQIVFIFFSL